jgi:hypothetical protein
MERNVLPVQRIRVAAGALAVAGVLFLLYPALRPYSDEVTLAGAEAFASALGAAGLWLGLATTSAERVAFRAAVITAVGVGLTLPFYGAEAFGLNAIGAAALRERSTAILAISSDVRGGFGLVVFLAGLVAVAVGAVLTAVAAWRSGLLARWSGVPFAIGFVLFVPQFFGSPAIRAAHGALVLLGCAWLAWELRRSTYTPGVRESLGNPR